MVDRSVWLHAEQRERHILGVVEDTGFVSYRSLEQQLTVAASTIRRDLARLAAAGLVERVYGGAKRIETSGTPTRHGDGQRPGRTARAPGVQAGPSAPDHAPQDRAIGLAAAGLCDPGEAIMIDGGAATLQMCEHVGHLGLQVLTNSLALINALAAQPETRIMVPSGSLFREQNLILAPSGETSMPRFHALKLFLEAGGIGPHGLMHRDPLRVAAQREMIGRSERLIVLASSEKFLAGSGAIVCGLEEVDILVTDGPLPVEALTLLTKHAIKIIVAR
ncbi:DeoR/GlpR family DNA-binding transcription regulator [Novosphingobium sp. PS1R-30]|uniref:DeoR/GlpR family DNA-binding transcription regulator n=1 Tax=Novosphingobium anseongense TaxID=3133436 RepID=A0ABU8S1Q3_9SPHN